MKTHISCSMIVDGRLESNTIQWENTEHPRCHVRAAVNSHISFVTNDVINLTGKL